MNKSIFNMRNLFTIIFFLSFSVFVFAQNNSLETSNTGVAKEVVIKEANWISSYSEAVKLSKQTNKPLLIFFTGSDFCGLCRQLNKHFFSSEEFITLADDELILYIADFPRRDGIVSPEQRKVNEKLKKKYNVGGYPTIVLVSSDAKVVLGKRMGFGFDHDTQYHFDLVRKAIKKNQ
jgi:thioredoxin-related protein